MQTKIIIQPSEARMGEIIQELLESQEPRYDRIWLISAFANAQAIERLAPSIRSARDRGTEIRLIVGFDVRSTSAEALQSINALGVNATLVHNAGGGHTFHPKVYLFESANLQADLFVGSTNLTDGGLYTNYEAVLQVVFELPQDHAEYTKTMTSLERFLNPQGAIAQTLSGELIDILVTRGEVPTESEIRENRRRTSRRQTGNNIPESPFGVERIARPPRLPHLPHRPVEMLSTTSVTRSAADIIWQKHNLPASDVQRQRGNVIGGLRLTKAGWVVGGSVINQTTYFRYDVFGHLAWSDWKTNPYSQKAEADFEVNILGVHYGVHRLAISHKPSGEAGQGNYTTILHWGDLAETIRELGLIGKTFSLYGPPQGQPEPFVIDIT